MDKDTERCNRLRDEWLYCRKELSNIHSKDISYVDINEAAKSIKKCRLKYSRYICECAGPFSCENKRFHCSILATH